MGAKRLAGVLVLAFIPGCASAPIPPVGPPVRPQALLDVPFFPDASDQCGPSVMASVLSYWGRPTTPAELKGDLYRASLGGSLALDFLLAARSRGMSAELSNGDLAQARRALDAGRPLIAFLKQGSRRFPYGHYVVLTGYDDRRQVLFAHSGTRKHEALPYRVFDRQWERTERWTLTIFPASL